MSSSCSEAGPCSSRSSLDVYSQEIGRLSLLSAEEERGLAVRIQAGDVSARNTLVESNLRFVVFIARKYQGQGLPMADLINEGNIGLINAADRYDADRGCRFTTFAAWWIRQSILKAIAQGTRTVRLPMSRIRQVSTINKAIAGIQGKVGCSATLPPVNELATRARLKPQIVQMLVQYVSNEVSLDGQRYQDSDATFISGHHDVTQEPPDSCLARKSSGDYLDRALGILDQRERMVIRHHFGLAGREKQSMAAIGVACSVSRERVRQLKRRALAKMKNAADADDMRSYRYHMVC